MKIYLRDITRDREIEIKEVVFCDPSIIEESNGHVYFRRQNQKEYWLPRHYVVVSIYE